MNSENLFRQQAIRSLSGKKPGPPICLMPRPWVWLSAVAVLLFVTTGFFVVSAEYAREESVRGWLVSKQGVVRVMSRTSAVIDSVVRQPGDHVEEGEALIYLSADSILANGSSQSEAVLAQLRREVLEIDRQLELSTKQQHLERLTLAEQSDDFDREVTLLESRLDAQRQIVEEKTDKLRRLKIAADDGAATRWDLIEEREELGVLKQGSSRLAQDIATQQREREQLRGHQESLPVRTEIQQSALRARRLQLEQQVAAQESRRLSVLQSPISGTVGSIEVHAGYSVSAQQILMTILPVDAELVAEVFVPSTAAGFIQPGQRVRIAYDAFPEQKFGAFEGQIYQVSKFVLLPGEIPQTFSIQEATYKVQIAIDDVPVNTNSGSTGLRPGMLLAANIILEKRNLIDWLLEPLRVRRTTAG